MSTPRFDLVDVVQTLRKRQRILIIVSVVTMVLGGVFFAIGRKYYKAEATFLMSNPLYTDRSNLFQDDQIQFVDYFAGDDDVDRLMTLAESDTIIYDVAKKQKLDAAWGLDLSNPKQAHKLRETFKDNYKAVRNEYNSCTIYYTDIDPERATNVANQCVSSMETIFTSYYIGQRNKALASIDTKISQLNSNIDSLTDSLASLRSKYSIYDLVSPNRQNLVSVSIKSNGSADFGKALELVQNLEAVKDKMVIDKAQYTSLRNQYAASIDTQNVHLMHIISHAKVPGKPKGLGLILTIIVAGMIGFFFTSVYILITTYYKALIAVER